MNIEDQIAEDAERLPYWASPFEVMCERILHLTTDTRFFKSMPKLSQGIFIDSLKDRLRNAVLESTSKPS